MINVVYQGNWRVGLKEGRGQLTWFQRVKVRDGSGNITEDFKSCFYQVQKKWKFDCIFGFRVTFKGGGRVDVEL